MKPKAITVLLTLLILPIGTKSQQIEWVKAWPDSLVGKYVNIPSLTFAPNGDLLAGAVYYGGLEKFYGIWKSTDKGETWKKTAFEDYEVWCFARDSNKIYAATFPSGIRVSEDNGETWKKLNNNNGLPAFTGGLAVTVSPSKKIFLGLYEGIWRSDDGGLNWQGINNNVVTNPVHSIVFNQDTLFITASYTVLKSTDNGYNWQKINGDIPEGTTFTSLIANNDYLIVSGPDYLFGDGGPVLNNIWRSNNGAQSWQKVLENTSIRARGFAVNKSGHIFAANGYLIPRNGKWGSLYRSTDQGLSWQLLSSTDKGILSIALDDSGYIFAGTEDGIYRSKMPLTNHPPSTFSLISPRHSETVQLVYPPRAIQFSWRKATDINGDALAYMFKLSGFGLDTAIASIKDTSISLNLMSRLQRGTVYSWTVSVSDGEFTVASPDTFSFFTSSTITAVEKTDQRPTTYHLSQNYPNPFNPSTTIEFSIPITSNVKLLVFNILGERVETLVDERLNTGTFRVRWDPHGLASGLYIYRIQAGTFVETKRMLLIK
jgi:photosystem II stability/assembly factor-like uncharacterized protein